MFDPFVTPRLQPFPEPPVHIRARCCMSWNLVDPEKPMSFQQKKLVGVFVGDIIENENNPNLFKQTMMLC